jgi:glycine/D-amino acid oxidase-like deaminating enzyme
MSTKTSPVVIVGGGIHGASVAYYLKELGRSSVIIEKAPTIAPAASGKSGGFLAREWGSGPTVQLHQKGFDMHVEIAAKLGISSFRELGVLSVSSRGQRRGVDVSWLDRASSTSLLDGAAAQVTPLELTQKLVEGSGADVILGTAVEGVDLAPDIGNEAMRHRVTGVRCSDGRFIETDTLVIAAGPWSGVLCEDWFGIELPMEGVRSTSIVFREGGDDVRRDFKALFCEEDEHGCHTEVYPRPDGSLYLCGLGGSKYIKGDELRKGGSCYFPEAVTADPLRVAAGLRSFRALSSLGDVEPSVTQACMRPIHPDALPTISPISPEIAGAFVSTGANCWGILWSLVMGRAMAELVVQGRATVVDLRPFSAQRFGGVKTQAKRGRAKGSVQVGEQW